MKQTIGIPMEIDPTPFLGESFYYYEEEYTSSLISSDTIKARDFHLTKRFLHFCAINDGG